MKKMMKRGLSFILTLVMILSIFPQFSLPAMAAGDPDYSFGTTNTGDGWSRSTGLPNTCSGKAIVALFFNGDTFPGEPRTHSGANYLQYNTSFEQTNGTFKASEILQGVIGSDSYVMGENSQFFGYYLSATSGIFDPNGLDDEHFTDNFRAALDAHEQDMIADVIAAKKDANQAVGSENPVDYEIVWYIIKYQTYDSTWHINGLIREKDKYSVVYDGNGATAGSPPDGVIDMSYSDAQNYTVQTNNEGLSRGDDYNFIGWNTKADGSGIFYSAGQKNVDLTTVGENPITLYAQWAEKNKVSVTWIDGDNKTIHIDSDLHADDIVDYDGAIPTKLPTNDLTYTFNDAWMDANGNEVTLPITMGNNNITLYAQFDSAPRTYTVTWVNHTVIKTDSGLSYGAPIAYDGAIPTRSTTETEGYLFSGWSTQENGAVEYDLRDTITVNGDMTLYAQFTLVPMRTVTWYSEDGNTVLATQKVLEGSQLSYPGVAPTKVGSSFEGWATSANGAAVYAAGDSITVSGNMNLYADFEPTKHTVTWIDWNDTVLETDTNVPYGDTPEYNGSTPVRADDVDKTYTFIGWTPTVDTVTGDIIYKATYSDAARAYTVTWNNYDNTLLKSESVNYGVTPVYTGSDPVRTETDTHTFTFIGWTPAVSAVTGDVTYTAAFQEVDKEFTATVKVWVDPVVNAETGAISDGTPKDLNSINAPYTQLYLRDVADSSKIYPLERTSIGTYTANVIHGTYVVVAQNSAGSAPVIQERIVLPVDTASSDPDSTSADLIFYSVTYDFAGGTFGGESRVVEYYQRCTDVTVSNYEPTRSQYAFDNWQLDDGSETYVSGRLITVLGSGIIKPHVLTAKWIRSNDNVVINLTIHHHADPELSGAIGMNPHPGSVPIKLDLTRRPEGGSGDYWEEGKKFSSVNWFSAGTTTEGTTTYNETEYATKTTTITFDSGATGFGNLPYDWDYSANILLEDYFLVERTVTETEGANGDVTYTVDAVLQYRPDLFNLSYTVEIDDATIAAGLTPTAVDLKILSYKNGAWSPISRHEHSSVEAGFTDASPVSGSYGVPVKDQQNNNFYYRVEVVGFTMTDGTELSASGADLINYSSDPTIGTETYQYAVGAYTAVVTVEGGVSGIGGVPAIYGSGDVTDGYSQVGTVTVTVYANAHTVTFDPNGGELSGSTDALVVPNQFRIPVLGNYVPTREGGYVFDGWQLNGSAAVTGTPITGDVTLVAKWKEPLTVSGEVRISTTDSHGNTLRSDSLPTSLSVTLERTTASGDKIIVQSKTYPLTESDYESGLGVVSYAFAPAEQDGSSYQVYVNVTNYNTAFLNEPGSNAASADELNDPAKYTGSRDAVDSDGDSDALVYAYLVFDPQEFNLTWQVDATAIGDSFRPDSLDIVARCDGENDTSVPFDEWEPIIQHYSNGVYTPENTEIGADGTATDYYPVWTVHPEGYAYDYAVKVHKWIKDGVKHDLTADVPFTVTYDPAIAWYNGTKQVTANPSQDHLLITLSPKSYTITYELNAGTDPVQGLNGEPTNHTWSHETVDIPQELRRDGYDFLGWTCNVAGAYADGKIKAEVAEDITLTAQWRKQKTVTFKVVNGTWSDDSTADITAYVSLDVNGNGSVEIPTGMNAAYGYGNGSWNDESLNGDEVTSITVSGDGNVTYIYSYQRLYHSVSYDTDGNAVSDAGDSVAHGDYIRIDPMSGSYESNSSVQDVQIEEAKELANPTRDGYIFAGWHRHYMEDTTTYPGSTIGHRYVAQWLRDENGDGVADALQKKIVFMIENGTWDGTNSDPIVKFVTLDGSGKADITTVIPSGMQPRAGFVAEDAFWSPAMPAGNIVSGNGEVSYTYHHYTTVTYSDFTQNGDQEQLLILPGSYIGIDPAGGRWDGNTSTTITQINGPYVLEDAVYTNHDFLGWQLNTASSEAEHIFTAQWQKDSYTITWKNEDDTVLETDENVELGTMPEYNGETPTKDADAQYTYTFKGWTPTVVAAEANTTYTAEFAETLRSYTVTWKNWDGSVLDTDTVEYGQMPAFASVPSRPATDEHTYTFSGWDKELAEVTGDVTYTATYSETTNQYTVTWLDEDGTELQSGLVDYGTMPTAPADPTKAATEQYTYTFSGWSPAVASVTGDAVYRASYSSTVNKYTVTWYGEDGVTVIATEEVEYGKVPIAPAAPAKENTDQYSYTFSGWKNGETTYIPASIPSVTGDVSYTAQFAQTTNKYTVTWKDFNGTELEKDTLVEYGTVPTFDSTSKLTKEDANSDYEFLGWYLSGDENETLVSFDEADDAAQKVTGDVTYIAKYKVTSKARTVTINVWLNATAADGTGGTPSTIGTVTNGQRGNLYLAPEASVTDSSTYIQANWNDTAKAYTASLMPGNYLIYAGNTAAGAVREANQIVSIVNTNVTVNTLYNSVTYNAGDGSFEGGQKTLTEYYKSGSGPVYVSQAVPALAGQVFTHWHDEASNVYNASTTAVPVKLIDSITTGYTLNAHWSDAADIQVIVNIDTVDENGQSDSGFIGKFLSLQLAGKASSSDSSVPYAAIYGTDISSQYSSGDSAWTVNGDVYTFIKTYANQRGDYAYQATALMANYALESISVSGNTVTINLKYDPAGFDLEFKIVVDENVPDELVPRAVDVQIVFFDRETGEWKMLSNTQNKALEVTLNEDAEGKWSGTGSYHVWSKYTSGSFTDELYLYRIAITDFDLGTNRGSLTASSADFRTYSSAAGNYHPAGAYTAEVTVKDLGCSNGEAGGLKGSHASGNEQHGIITATVNVAAYDVVKHYNDADNNVVTVEDRFLTPELDTPTYTGHTFAGWWTKDGTGGDWGTQVTAAGTAIKSLVNSGTTLDLYARWNQDLMVTGEVKVSNEYQGSTLYDHDRPSSVRVELRNAQTNALVSSAVVPLTDDNSDKFRSGTYTFENVPDNGASYRISVVAPNYTVLFRNETVAANAEYSENLYAVVDGNNDDEAVVDVYMEFTPHNFDLEYTVDATNIRKDFRPTVAGVVVLSGDSSKDPQSWDIIAQQLDGENVDAHEVAIDVATGKPADSGHDGASGIWHHYPVWRRSPFGDLYEYAIQLWTVRIGDRIYGRDDMASAPFTVIYAPAFAWYDSETGKQTAPPVTLSSGITLTHPDPSNSHGLVAYIVPNSYTVTYELGRTGTVSGVTSIDGNTARGSFLWSHGLTEMPEAMPTGASGVTFGGWWTKDGTNGDWGTPVTSIGADTAENLTLYARWKYTVTWNADNGSTPTTESILEGIVPTAPVNPTKDADSRYSYTFTGWSPTITAVTGNVTYTAKYATATNSYTVTWKNGEETLDTDTVAYGKMPAYTGVTPTKASTEQYSYTFSGWTPALATVTGDVTYNATFAQTERSYTVTWKNHDGTTLDVDANVGYGVLPSYDGATPSKTGDAQYSYSFIGWKADGNDTLYTAGTIPAVTGNVTYTAQFEQSVNTYTVTWKNWDGSVLETDSDVAYGTMPSFDSAEPTRTATPELEYHFFDWDKSVAAVIGDVVYTAQYYSTTRTYVVIWKDSDGTTLETDPAVPFGTTPKYDGATPVKAADAQYTYTFDKWSPEVSSVTGDIIYTASYSTTVNKYTVTWKDDNGDVLKSEQLEYGVTPSYDGTPTKAADAQYTYTFSGWTPAIAVVSGNATYSATYSGEINSYTVKWIDWDGTVLKEETLEYGATPTAPENPARTQEGYTFTFAGWDETITTVTRDATYQALYTSDAVPYTIIWVDENGNKLHEETHYYGDRPIYPDSDPVKNDTAQYTYAFAGWKLEGGTDTLYASNNLPEVTEDVTYKAQFSNTIRKYTITWLNENGTTLKTEQVEYGAVPSYSGDGPTKEATAEFSYTHTGWSPTISPVSGDATYTATFTAEKRSYTITWQNEDGTELAVDTLEYGKMPSYTGATPTKAATGRYTYTHSGWTPTVKSVTGNATYKATYTMQTNQYTITWKDEDDSVLRTDTMAYGDTPVYGGAPTKTGDVQYSYTFDAWTPSVAAVTGNAEYTATYTQHINKYTVTWKNDGGAVLATEQVEYGTVPAYAGETPTKEADAQYTYTFNGWDNIPVEVTGDVTYTATYSATVNKYTVTWVNWDDTVLETDTDVPYGTMPSYDGADPTRPDTTEHVFTWNLWDQVVAPVTGDVTYKAIFVDAANTYTVIWKNYDGAVLETDTGVPYGDMPSYDGEIPTKAGDAQYSYAHNGWTPVVQTVTGNEEYTATFAQTVNSYTITWKNDGGAVLATEQVEYGTVPAYAGETPTKEADAQYTYTFSGWDNDPVAVTGDATYTATYSTTVNKYTVTWVNWDDTVLETDLDVPYGTMPSYDGADPTRPDTTEHVFTWNLWDKVVSPVSGDTTYKAVFVDAANTYTVIWKNYDGTVLETDTDVPFGAMPSYDGAVPTKVGDAQHSYVHSGWTPAVQTVSGDVEYAATFMQTVNSYTVTYTDGVDGTEVFADQVYAEEYGALTPAFVGTPSRAGYTFGGWTPAVSDTVTGDVVYTAQWTANAPVIPVVPPASTTGTAKLVKVDADDQSSHLKNVVFELYKADGTLLGEFKTDANGQITVSSLASGEYYWLETRPAEGYVLDSTKHSFTVAAGQTAALTVTNKHSEVPTVFSGDHYAYIVGYSDGKVHPEANITRAEVATIFFRLLDNETRERYLTKENTFSDVENGMWFNTAVSTMAAMGIINGYPDGDFHPNANITRAEFAAIAARFDSNANTTGVSFTDIYGHWAQKEINIAANNGWILGYENGEFRPNQNITRAEAMAMVNRVLQRIPESKEDLLDAMVKWSDNMDTTKWYYLTVQEATNSHDYGRKNNGYEYWTTIKEVPDWAALER